MHQAIDAPLQLNKGNGYEKSSQHSPPHNGSINHDKGRFYPRLRINSLLEDERNRQNSIVEEGPYVVPRGQRRLSMELSGLRKRMDSNGGESYYSLGELRSRTSTLEDPSPFRKTFRITNSSHYLPSPSQEKQRTDTLSGSPGYSVHDSRLPKLSQKWDNTEVFHGLIHPDNIINHHHYLPYEADKSHKQHHHGDHNGNHRGNHNGNHHGNHNVNHHGNHNGNHHGNHNGYRHDDRHHDEHLRHLHGYYIHKYDHMGTRQIAHIPVVGAPTHIAEMLDKQYEPESNHYSLLSNLRQLLSVYQRMDETLPRKSKEWR
ncbi:hypothetical protein QZH41_002820 [Actinostola sp. cb2023]|nr:hypothetical protein QZH41_002820 [Actinostola sp. cb2023]